MFLSSQYTRISSISHPSLSGISNPSNELIVGAISSWVYFIFSLYSMPRSRIYQTIGWVLGNRRAFSGESLLSARWIGPESVSYTHLRAHETPEHLVCRLLLEKK